GKPYGSRLRGRTPLYVRYNTGRHVSENGASLDALLDTLPEVEGLAIVGHSMGGLVARSACHQGALRGAAWTRRVRHVVSLGTRSGGCSATPSSSPPAPRGTAGRGGSRSPTSTGSGSARRTISRCSTTRRCTTSCGPGWRADARVQSALARRRPLTATMPGPT